MRRMESNEETVLEIVTIGNPVLNRKADKITNIDQHVHDLAMRMVKTMHFAPGIGLAAPQVDQSIQLITVDLSVGENSANLIVLANPELLHAEGETIIEEGCLSVPGINEKVTRPYRVIVKGIDLEGKEKIFEAEDLLARVFCHEIDHINGKLFIEHLSPLKKSLIRKKLKKQKENNDEE
jgi:peptide deformylase